MARLCAPGLAIQGSPVPRAAPLEAWAADAHAHLLILSRLLLIQACWNPPLCSILLACICFLWQSIGCIIHPEPQGIPI